MKKTQYEHWCGKLLRLVNHLRTWEEPGKVQTITGNVSKVLNSGVQCMFVGYSIDHDGDVYCTWNPNTNRVLISRDIIWLKRMYFEPKVIPEIEVQPEIEVSQNDDSDGEKIVVIEKKWYKQ